MKTAILVDGGFFLKKYRGVVGFNHDDDPSVVAANLSSYCYRHIKRINDLRDRLKLPRTELYRIFYYDAKPYSGDAMNPVSGKNISFKKSDQYQYRHLLFAELKKQRKIALRLGFLKSYGNQWVISPQSTKDLISGKIKVADLKETDVSIQFKQKAVDMKIGLDIATLAFKNQVDQILLIAGDSDFVPAAKFARKEGVDFLLDPMLNHIDPTLEEHIDGLMTIKSMQKRINGKK